MARIRAASDVGGTFTDLVYFDVDPTTGQVTSVETEKAHTTPPNFEKGVSDAFDKANISLKDVEFFAHGTTVVINALTERKGVKTGLITTRGFRDILEIARGNRPDFFNLRYQKPEPFVPRHLRHEVTERMSYKGEVLGSLELSELAPIVDALKKEKVEAVAICLLHSYANPAHEITVAKELKRLWPEITVVSSHQISRECVNMSAPIRRRFAPMYSRPLKNISAKWKTGWHRKSLAVRSMSCNPMGVLIRLRQPSERQFPLLSLARLAASLLSLIHI